MKIIPGRVDRNFFFNTPQIVKFIYCLFQKEISEFKSYCILVYHYYDQYMHTKTHLIKQMKMFCLGRLILKLTFFFRISKHVHIQIIN